MIIAFAGRKQSGKTTLANFFIEKGFKKISFADKLRDLVSKIYTIPVLDLKDSSKKEVKLSSPLKWTKIEAKILSELIGVSCEFLFHGDEYFNTYREALQYIGTSILRKYDNDFHIKSIKEYIEPNANYVIDDVRFKNELECLKKYNAICIFVLRPFNFNYSNHKSEIDLDRHSFEYVILNNKSKKTLIRKSSMFFEDLLCKNKKNVLTRKALLDLLCCHNFNTFKVAESLNCSRDKIIWWSTKYCIHIPREKYTFDHDVFSRFNSESAYWAGLISADGTLKKNYSKLLLELSSDDIELIQGFKDFLKSDKSIAEKKRHNGKISYSFTTSSYYMIEDMKLWCIEPKKSKYNKIPDCIQNGRMDLFDYWFVGLIDGDGSIYKTKQGFISLSVLASEQVIDFIQNHYKEIKSCKYSEKGIENLYCLVFNGKYCIDLYKRIYKGIGLKRKWNKLEQYLKN